MHQLVAEAFLGPCPPGHKLVHLNGNGLDNRRANLAYVPESDPRPAAPLNPRPPGHPTKTAVTRTDPDDEGELVHQLLPETFVGPYKTVHLKKPRPTDVMRKTVVTRNAVTRKKRHKGKKKRRLQLPWSPRSLPSMARCSLRHRHYSEPGTSCAAGRACRPKHGCTETANGWTMRPLLYCESGMPVVGR